MSGNPYSKGVSYVRRIGAEISNVAAKKFSQIILSSNNRQDVIKLLAMAYSSLVALVNSGVSAHIYRIRATKNAITSDFIRVCPTNESGGARYTAFSPDEYENEEESNNVVDKEFYIETINRCLKSICKAIGLPDEQHVIWKSNT